jgi:hypothetical protein
MMPLPSERKPKVRVQSKYRALRQAGSWLRHYLFTANPLWPVQGERMHRAEQIYEAWFTLAIVPLLLLGLLAAVHRWDQPVMMPALLIFSLVLLVWVFKSDPRYRVPFDACVIATPLPAEGSSGW